MPYSDKDHDRALSRLQADLDRLDAPTCQDTRAGLAFAIALICALGALGLLLAL